MSATTTLGSFTSADWIPPRIRRMTLDEYERMVEEGIVPSRNRFHFINGYVVEKKTHTPLHSTTDMICGLALDRAIPAGWHVRSGAPIRLSAQWSEPEPDRCVIRGTIVDYARRHPGPEDVVLVVEVADSSLAEDRDYANRLYGPAGIPLCWIIDVNDRRVEVYTEPGPQGYGAKATFHEGQTIPLVIDGREVARIAIADILPPV